MEEVSVNVPEVVLCVDLVEPGLQFELMRFEVFGRVGQDFFIALGALTTLFVTIEQVLDAQKIPLLLKLLCVCFKNHKISTKVTIRDLYDK